MVNSIENIQEQNWLEVQLTKKNIIEYMNFLINNFSSYEEDLTIIKKKLQRNNKSALSLLISFVRTIDSNDSELESYIRKLIQELMDNPRGLKKK